MNNGACLPNKSRCGTSSFRYRYVAMPAHCWPFLNPNLITASTVAATGNWSRPIYTWISRHDQGKTGETEPRQGFNFETEPRQGRNTETEARPRQYSRDRGNTDKQRGEAEALKKLSRGKAAASRTTSLDQSHSHLGPMFAWRHCRSLVVFGCRRVVRFRRRRLPVVSRVDAVGIAICRGRTLFFVFFFFYLSIICY
jgi:hypothetical protein